MNIQYLVSDLRTHATSSSSRSTSHESTGSSNTAISTEAPPSSKNSREHPSIKNLSDTPPSPPSQIPELAETSPITLAAGEVVFRHQGDYSGGKWKPYEDRALAKQVIASDCVRGESGLARRSWSQVSLNLEKAEPLPVKRSATACKSRFWWLAKVGKNIQGRNVKTMPASVVAAATEVWLKHNQQTEKTQVREAAEVPTQLEENIPSENKEGGDLLLLPQQALLRDEVGIVQNFGAARGIHFYDGLQASESSLEQRRRRKENYRRRSSFSLKQTTPESALTADGGEPPPRRHSESMIQEANSSGGQMHVEHADREWNLPSEFVIQTTSAVDIMNRLLAQLQAERMQRAQEHRELMGMLIGIVGKGG